MELSTVKHNLTAIRGLLRETVEEIDSRVNKKHERMAEEDLVVLRAVVLENIELIEKADGLIGRYGRSEFGSKLFAPTAKVVAGERVWKSYENDNGEPDHDE